MLRPTNKVALAVMWVAILCAAVFVVDSQSIRIWMFVIAAGVTVSTLFGTWWRGRHHAADPSRAAESSGQVTA